MQERGKFFTCGVAKAMELFDSNQEALTICNKLSNDNKENEFLKEEERKKIDQIKEIEGKGFKIIDTSLLPKVIKRKKMGQKEL